MTRRQSIPLAIARTSRWRRVPESWVAVLVAGVLVALIAAALASSNAKYYEVWIYNDPQTSEEQRDWLMVDVFMAHTSGFFWNQFIVFFLGAFLGARLRGMLQALAAAVLAGAVLAAVNFAVAWHTSAHVRRRLAWWLENSSMPVPADLLADEQLQHVLAAGLAAFPLAALAGVGLGNLIAPALRGSAVLLVPLMAISTVFWGVPLGIFGWVVAASGDEPIALLAVLALVPPPAAAIPSAVRTALVDHGDAFTITMLISNAAWALALILAGWVVQRRRTRRALAG
ncbi:hypothetical protein [Asanoa siamensis]|uniref:ABC-2 type transport system permease protein n=1 Tax=Asanoa siamensis TaxID=926357 RepID=A0ABQ4CZN9_9ACTN|nr:hypothetical protein [Asanoa siamensis]GIF76463.1 hypothetical protein Asi02nite_59810 [Asanoa siamensis]